MFDTRREGDVLTFARANTDFLSTGWRGGRRRADAAYSVTVPKGWHPDDVAEDLARRLSAAGVDHRPDESAAGEGPPVLITGVAAENCRGARCGPVEAYATTGLSNPAALPPTPESAADPAGDSLPAADPEVGTVNLLVGTTRALSDGALANLVAVAAEAKAVTLSRTVDVPGTTSDAVVVAADPAGPPARYSGSATAVGAAARACVREAVTAALAARYDGNDPESAVADADHRVVTDVRAETFLP
ncbi:MAG: adenosylcobinamide amidohydrolase [Halolamina sp.]